MKKILVILSFVFGAFAALPTFAKEAITLQQKFATAQPGDYIVTAQEGNYSLLFIRSMTPDILLLEEISVPQKQVDLKKVHWKEWVQSKAPGHTSWTITEINRKSGELIECFSYSKNGWLYMDCVEHFLTKLFILPLEPVAIKDRKKIGPPPDSDEEDRRALWNPALIFDGKKVNKPSFEVLKTKWPDDGSRLSLCAIELYFSQHPFPYWIEVQSAHYAFKLRAVDSGHEMISPIKGGMPHRPPQFVGLTHKGKQLWKITVKVPSYFQKLHLFASDCTADKKETLSIPFTADPGSQPEEMILEVSPQELNKILKPGHRYRWTLVPNSTSPVYVESEEFFMWP